MTMIATRPSLRGRSMSHDSWKLSECEPLPPEVLQDCIRRYKNEGDTAAADRVVQSHLRLVARLARSFASNVVLTDDLMSEGALALRRALDTFDVDRGPSFTSYASVIVGHALRTAARTDRQSVRIPSRERQRAAARHRAESTFFASEGHWPTLAEVDAQEDAATLLSGDSTEHIAQPLPPAPTPRVKQLIAQRAWVSLDSGTEDGRAHAHQVADEGPTPAEEAVLKDDVATMLHALQSLPETTARAVRLRFGVGEESPLAVTEVATRLRIPTQTTERLIADGLRKLRARVESGLVPA